MTEDTPTRLAAIQARYDGFDWSSHGNAVKGQQAVKDIHWLLTEHAERLQAERNELRNAIAGCGEHTPNVSHAYMVALAKDNAEAEEALNGDAGAKVQLEAAEAARDDLRRQVDELQTLAKVGTWHTDCRPNREMAARELAKSQAVIDKLADRITELEAARDEAQRERDGRHRTAAKALLAAGTETP